MIEILVYPVDEVAKEIDGLMDNFKEMELQKDKEIERLREERQCLKGENSEAIKQFAENRIKIEQLKKEKEYWKGKLKYEYIRYEQGNEWADELISDHEKDLQQILKGK